MNEPARPNIIVILADDMGFSDIGCFGSEIRTPNLDRMAEGGFRFTQMYNCARCCPTRASLLTGVSPHRAGVGHMVGDYQIPGYRGYLSEDVVTIAEVLGSAGYRTLLSGKWHVGGSYRPDRPEQWNAAGDPGHPTPRQRGFDRFYGILAGGGSYYRPITLCDDDTFIDTESPTYYLTDAVSAKAVEMIGGAAAEKMPFFMYLSYTAPHWPLHARPEDIAKYEGSYRRGWDAVRTARHETLKGMGILDKRWDISPRDPDSRPWETVQDGAWEDLRMAVYAAQVEAMDRGIGTVLGKIRDLGQEENTLVMFLSDNGGCAEFLNEDGDADAWPGWYARPTVDGRAVTVGNVRGVRPGDDQTFMSYDLPWANASNSPFRLFKHWVHEGGIATPMVVRWPKGLPGSGIVNAPCHVMDIMATCLDAARVSYPSEYGGRAIVPLEGESFLGVARVGADRGFIWHRKRPIFWEHEGNRAVRDGQWKLVSRYPGEWELYDMFQDRTELHDRAEGESDRVSKMVGRYDEWAMESGVRPWPVNR